jgi:hypothetical protein
VRFGRNAVSLFWKSQPHFLPKPTIGLMPVNALSWELSMISSLFRILPGLAAPLCLLCLLSSTVDAQIPKVECKVGDKVIVDFLGKDCEATVTEVIGDGVMIRATLLDETGRKIETAFGARQVKLVKPPTDQDLEAENKELPSDGLSTDRQADETFAGETLAGDLETNRTWTSADGKFTISAKLAGKSGNTVRLLRTNGKATRIELEKLCQEDQDYIEAALRKARAVGNPFSDGQSESNPANPFGEDKPDGLADQAETAAAGTAPAVRDRATETDRGAVAAAERTLKSDEGPAVAPATRPQPQPANGRMPLLAWVFLRFGFSGLIFGPLLLSGVTLLAFGLKNANRYY